MTAKNAKGKETRARILEAAAHEFASRGFREATTADILSRVGLTQPAFYKHFLNKQAVYDELIGEFRFGFYHVIQSVQLSPELHIEDVTQQINGAVAKVFRFLNTNPALTKIGLIHDSNAETLKGELADLIANNIRAEQKLKYLTPTVSPEIVGECLVGMIERLTVQFLFPGIKTPEDLANDVVNLLGPALIIQ